MSNVRTVSPATVRQALGLTKSTGRLSDADIKRYNKGKAPGQRYEPGAYAGPAIEVTAKPEKGRAKSRKVVVSEVRAAAREAGVPVGARGRLAPEVMQAYVLGTLSTLAQAPQEAPAE